MRLIDEAAATAKLIAVFTQRDASVEEPAEEDLYRVGTATHIHKMFKLPDGSLRLIVQGPSRVSLKKLTSRKPYLLAEVEEADEIARDEDRLEVDALQRNIKTNFQQVVSLSPLLSDDLQTLAMNIAEPGKLADFIVSSLADHHHRREAGSARHARRARAHGSAQPAADQGTGSPGTWIEDPIAGTVRGRQEPARILPARTAQGHPARAG